MYFFVPCLLRDSENEEYLLSANAMIGRVNTGLGPEVKFPLTVCCEFSLLTEPPRSREIDKITEFADIARENAHFQQHAWGYISEQLQNTRPLTPFLNILLP